METGEKKFDGFEELVLELGMARIFFAEEEEEEEEARIVVSIKDITERKQAEEGLREANELHQNLFNNTGTATIIVQKNGTIVMANTECYAVTGYRTKELIGTKWAKYVVPESLEQMVKYFKSRFENPGESPKRYETRLVNVKGEVRDTIINIGLIPNSELIIVSMIDITERKRAEEELRESEERYRSLFENNHAVMLLIDPDNAAIMDANPAACTYYGWSREELMKRRIDEINTLRSEEVAAEMQLARSEKRNRFFFKHRCADDTIRDVEVYSGQILLKGKALLYSIVHDITERKLAEEALRVSEQKYRSIFDNAVEGIFQSTTEGKFLTVNPAFARMHGYKSPEEMIQGVANIKKQLYADPIRREEFTRVLHEQGVITNFEHQQFRKDGSTIWVRVNAQAVRDDDNNVLYYEGAIEDITERKLAEGREQLARNVLELLNHQQGTEDMVRDILLMVKKSTGVEAVGIRLQEGDDFPYYETNGFSEDFIQAERHLCVYDEEGKIVRDEKGNPVLECMCGNIICGRTNPALPFFTERGSFWTNSTTDLLASTTEEDRQSRTRNRCNSEGYESVALIPLRSNGDIIGLLQLNDHRRNCFTLEMIRFFEGLGASIGIALSHKRMEDTLTKSGALLREAQGVAHIGHWELDTSIMTPTWSEEIFHIFGLDPKEGEPSFEAHQKVTHPDDWGILNNAVTTSIVEGIPFNIEFRILRPDKTIRWMYAIGYPKKDSEGRIVSVFGTAQDITDRKLMEDTLQESEERFRRLSEAAFEAIAIHEEGVLLNANDQFFKMFGYEPGEVLGKQVMPMTVAPEAREFMTKQIATGGLGPYESTGLRKDGTSFQMEIRARQMEYKGRNVRVGAIVDITERKQAEDTLRESEDRYRTLTEKTIAGIYLIQDGLFKYVNPTFCEIHGYTKDELVDKFGSLDLVVEEEKKYLNDKIQQRLSGEKESDQFSVRIRKKDGEIRFLEVFGSRALYAGKPAVLGTCIDITETKKANEEIKKSREELRALTAYLQNIREEERIRIAREIHDELGQSLTGIKIDISWLKKKLDDIVKPTDPIQAKIDSLLGLTESAIATTRELSLSLRPGILDDLGLVTAINWQMKRFQEKTGIICTFQSDKTEITIPEDHTTALFRICQECLTNIARHAHATEVNITLTEKGGNLVLEIEDNGKGIKTEQTRSPLSLGILGMRERAGSLRGRFSIRGAPGKGTKVKVEVPVR